MLKRKISQRKSHEKLTTRKKKPMENREIFKKQLTVKVPVKKLLFSLSK